MNKLLDKLLQFFKGKKKAETPITPKPKVKRQNAVPPLKQHTIESKAHKEMPKKHSVDQKVVEVKKKTTEAKSNPTKSHTADTNKNIADPKKAKRKKYYYKKLKGKKPSGTEGNSGSSKS
jgi:hypothetical protein